ncbi:MAG: DUF3867 domain-containing protein [Clostridium sp.]|uniref:DUF3867 domain-containing protein n=1 Tax=Clostridium sp. TaxID=1506 RepID=UPI003056C08C
MSDVIDFNELRNKATDKDVDKFEDYIYSMYYSMAQGKVSMSEMSKQVFKYMKDNNISQEKFINIQKKVMDRYGVSTEDLENQMKSMGIDTQFDSLTKDYEETRKVMGFQEKYKGKLNVKNVRMYYIKNEKNDLEVILDEENIILKSYMKIDVNDNELNEFLCSYKKVMNDNMLNISICENSSTYRY